MTPGLWQGGVDPSLDSSDFFLKALHYLCSSCASRVVYITDCQHNNPTHFWKALDQAREQRVSLEWWPLCWGNIYTAALYWATLRCVSSSLSGLLPMSLHSKNSKSSDTKTQKERRKLAQNHTCSTRVTQVSACPWCSFLHFAESLAKQPKFYCSQKENNLNITVFSIKENSNTLCRAIVFQTSRGHWHTQRLNRFVTGAWKISFYL